MAAVESREREDGRAVRKRDDTRRRNGKRGEKNATKKEKEREARERATARSEARDSTDLCVREVE